MSNWVARWVDVIKVELVQGRLPPVEIWIRKDSKADYKSVSRVLLSEMKVAEISAKAKLVSPDELLGPLEGLEGMDCPSPGPSNPSAMDV